MVKKCNEVQLTFCEEYLVIRLWMYYAIMSFVHTVLQKCNEVQLTFCEEYLIGRLWMCYAIM
jgi:hypothetical protein